ncbi:MAG TPA: glycosyltransferase family 39 protein [Humisphaera sp.]|nr:glycosyltransferase family 39 protein [Humisphaera sp.]
MIDATSETFDERHRRDRSIKRCAVYTAALIVMSGVIFFTNLGGSGMYADEAQYALCVEHARESGNWLTFSPYPPHTYYQKPPMYFWLTGLTYRFFGEGVVRYRFWSALFGVGCVGLTCVLGAMLLSSEVGALGGLLLLGNRYFQVDHGARSGSMDTAVTFCSLACLVIYWLAYRRRVGSRAWASIGAIAGLACLFKPAAGAPVLAILAIHSLLLDRKIGGMARSIRGNLLAVVVCLAVVCPYYLLVWHRAGGQIFHDMFRGAIVDTALAGDPGTHEHMFRDAQGDPLVARRFAGHPWYAMLFELHRSSIPFALAGVGIVFAIAKAARGRQRSAYALLALTSVLYMLIFSMSVVKRIRYLYPAFPAISLAMAASWIEAIAYLLGGFDTGRSVEPLLRRVRFFAALAAICAALIFIEAVRFTHNQIDRDRCNFEAWKAYQTFKPAIADGRLGLVFFGFPPSQFEWRQRMGLDAADCFYLEQMHEAQRVDNPRDLKKLLDRHTPMLLIDSRFPDTSDVDGLLQTGRSDSRFTYLHRAFRLHGIDLQSLLMPHLTPDSPCAGLELLDSLGRPLAPSPAGFVFTNDLIVRIAPPLRADAWLNIRLAKCPNVADVPVRFHALLKDALMDWEKIGTLSHHPQIALKIGHGQWSRKGCTDVVVHFLADDRSGKSQTIQAAVTEASLRVFPEPFADR